MKHIIVILLLSALASTCRDQVPQQAGLAQVTIMVDWTDPQQLLPDASYILRMYRFEEHPDQAGSFRLAPITDRQLNPARQFLLPDARATVKDNILDDPMYRQKIVGEYYNKIRGAISGLRTDYKRDTALPYSECFAAICDELRRLKAKEADRNVLLVYSDLQEHSLLFDSYAPTNRELLAKSPKRVIDVFNSSPLVPGDLNGIEIHFLYQPRTRLEDANFRTMASIFEHVLTSRGARVLIQADDNITD
jgi:hypothetical protein